MAIIPGIQICIPQWSNRADAVIAGLEKLLVQRKHGIISRRVFLVAWRKKRLALRLTPDYQRLQHQVRSEAGGLCERCRRRAGDHMHHKTPVAYEPRRALVRSNCKWVCVECHPDEDFEAQERMRRHLDRRRLKLEAKLGDPHTLTSGRPSQPNSVPQGARSLGASEASTIPSLSR